MTLKTYEYENRTSKFDLTLSDWEEEILYFSFEYCTKLFTDDTIERFIGYFKQVVHAVAAAVSQDIEIKIADIEILPEKERWQILLAFNDTGVEYPADKMIHGLFAEQVETAPDHTALVGKIPNPKSQIPTKTAPFEQVLNAFAEMHLSYSELNEKSHQLAHFFRERGVQPDSIVAIMAERSIEMIIGILGILKAGGAYLPIDPDYSQERISFMLADSSAKLLVTTRALAGEDNKNPGTVFLDFSTLPPFYPSTLHSSHLHLSRRYAPVTSLAYIIYTSGSTGRPKGVMVEHPNVVRLVKNSTFINWRQGQRLLMTGTIVFDITTFEIWGPLLNGLHLYLGDKGMVLDVEKLSEAVAKNKISVLHLIPQLFSQVLDRCPEVFAGLEYFLVGGDMVRPGPLNRLRKRYRHVKIIHCYGPTENTTFSTTFPVDKDYDERIPIGKPIQNSMVYILNHRGGIQPLGVVGQLCTGGSGVARGYLNNPELTAEKFSTGPRITRIGTKKVNKKFLRMLHGSQGVSFFKKSPPGRRRLYKTGDLARWLPDGNIEFLGRMDNQVKIRGFRIEPGEIENRLLKHQQVKEAVVVTRGLETPENKYICAYIVWNPQGNVDKPRSISRELKEYLSHSLPDYMIPSYFTVIRVIPLTHSGKVDRKALPEPEAHIKETYAAPRKEIEKKLVEIWSEVLSRDTRHASQLQKTLGIHHRFFDLGGDSIKAIQTAARMSKSGYKVEIKDIFTHPSIAELAPLVKKKLRTADQSIITGIVPLTPIQKRFFENESSGKAKHHFNHAVMLYNKNGFNEVVVKKVFEKIVQHHDTLRMVYKFNHETDQRRKGHEQVVVVQENRGIDGTLLDFKVVNLKDRNDGSTDVENEIEKEADRIHESIDLTTGPLVKLGLFKTPRGDHLLIVIHHLVMDGISWRILLEDFHLGCRQMEKGEEIKFQEKTDSFKYWSEKLTQYATGADGAAGTVRRNLLKELAYWRESELEAAQIDGLPVIAEISREKRKHKYMETLEVKLHEEETGNLLERVNWAYNTEINDILLTALAMALKQWTGKQKALIHLEGHGRESIIQDVDIARTVGWFTTLYPVILDLSQPGSENLSYAIKHIKETLRRIPGKGIGYGILRYLTPAQYKSGYSLACEPGISFNYLGQVGQEITTRGLVFSWLNTGKSTSPQLEQKYTLDINGMVLGGKLTLLFSYNIHEYDKDQIQTLADHVKFNLLRIITHCRQKRERELTPSDVGYPGLSLKEFSRLSDFIQTHMAENPEIRFIYSLSPMQNGMLYHSLRAGEEEADAYFVQSVFKLRGEIEKSLLEDSFNHLIQRYDILRTVFYYDKLKEAVQVVLKTRPMQVYYEDITHLQEEEQVKYLETYERKDKERGFVLTRDILMRVSLFRTGLHAHHLVWSFHHIVMDGWCLGIIYKDLLEIYRWLSRGQAIAREAAPPYRNYIEWLGQQDKAAGIAYWQTYLEGYELHAGLPGLNPAEPIKDNAYKLEEYRFELDQEETFALNRISRKNHTTINTVFQALWGILLQKYNNSNDVVFGAVVSGRPPGIEGIEDMVGLFINTIPVRVKTHENQEFIQLLRNFREETLLSRSYEYLSLAEIQANSALKTNPIDHIAAFENYPLREELKNQEPNQGNPFRLEHLDIYQQTNYNFNVIIVPGTGKSMAVMFSYNALVYEKSFIEKVGLHLKQVIGQVRDNPGITPEEIEIITMEERKQIMFEFNQTSAGYPKDKTIYELFAEQVERTPQCVALIGRNSKSENRNPKPRAPFGQINALGEMHLSYRELNRRSGQLARLLVEKGVNPDTIVGMLMERSIETIIGILGILKAGGAYLPIDPDYPQERINYMLADSKVKILVKENIFHLRARQKELIVLDFEDLNFEFVSDFGFGLCAISDLNASNLAYIIYTSGTTGKAKGTAVEHKNVVRLMVNDGFRFDFTSADVWTLFHSYCFDFSVWEMYGALLYGGKLIIIPKMAARDTGRYLEILKEQGVTVLNQTPSAFYNLMDLELREPFDHLKTRYVIFGGEALHPGRIKEWGKKYPGTKLVNMYGITETTVHVTFKEIKEREMDFNISNIGKPIPTLCTYIIDKHLKLQPIGTAGELCVSGEGVCRGYLNRPELTAERFDHDLWDLWDDQDKKIKRKRKKVPGKKTLKGSHKDRTQSRNHAIMQPCIHASMQYHSPSPHYPIPPLPHSPIYRTGDLARWLSNGEMEYLGRIDHQVKIRGFRVEPGEIENRILAYEQIKEVVVIEREDESGNRYLAAYMVPREVEKGLDIPGVREYLAGSLPDYMIPAYFLQLEQIPLTANGKIDRKALPAPGLSVIPGDRRAAPRDENEKQMVRIWGEKLGMEQPGIRDNYFHIGGDSIKAIRLLSVINEAFDAHLKLVDLFTHETIEKLVREINRQKSTDEDKTAVDNEALKAAHKEIETFKNKILAGNRLSDFSNDNIQDLYPMSDIEKGMVFHSQKEPDRAVFHDQMVYQVKYIEFDIERYKRAVELMVEKHPILRTAFIVDEFAHVVYKKIPIDIFYYDISGTGKAGQEAYIANYMAESRGKPFNVTVPPLWRMSFFNIGAGNIAGLWEFHHAILDGWSNASLLTELNNTYLELKENPGYRPQKLKCGYKDYILEQLAEKRKSHIMDYWKSELSDYKRLNMPGSYGPRPEAILKIISRSLGKEKRSKLEAVAQKYNTSLKHLCFAAYFYMVSMLSYENDMVVGLTTNCRPLCEHGDKIIGCFLNTIPFRMKIPTRVKWSGFIRAVDEKMKELKKYDRLPLPEIIRLIGEQAGDVNPIYDVLFNFVDFHVFRQLRSHQSEEVEQQGHEGVLDVESYEKNNFPLSVNINVPMESFDFQVIYSTQWCSDQLAQKLVLYFENLLDTFIQKPETLVNPNSILPEGEKQTLLFLFNNTWCEYTKDKTLQQLFLQEVEKTPHRAAVGKGDELITYRELNQKSGQLAHSLMLKGIQADTIAALVVERSLEMIIGILAILKAGGAYLPIDPDYPEERIRYMLSDSGANILLTTPGLSGKFEKLPMANCQLLMVNEKPPYLRRLNSTPKEANSINNYQLTINNLVLEHASLAYLIYTSGTSGKPKGVMVEHRNVVSLVKNSNFINWRQGQRLLMTGTVVFDITTFEIWGPLLNGLHLVLADKSLLLDVGKLSEAVAKNKISILHLIPQLFSQVWDQCPEVFTGLEYFLVGGDLVPPGPINRLRNRYRHVKIIHCYGPTENTTFSTTFPVDKDYDERIPIGKPIQNSMVYILNHRGGLQPIGVVGQLCTAGSGVARGYLNNPELTAEKFDQDLWDYQDYHDEKFLQGEPGGPYAPGPRLKLLKIAPHGRRRQKIYRSGDLARWLPDGNIEFLGRIDRQVKIRGFRVELGEIQNRLLKHKDIKEAVVVDHVDAAGDKYLCAYILLIPGPSGPSEVPISELRRFLSQSLPGYMVPTYFIELNKIPLTPNGKIDRKALPVPEIKPGKAYLPPRDKIEEELVEIWSEVLGRKAEEQGSLSIGIDDNFFELGGHSLKATLLTAKIYKKMEIKIPLEELFRAPTVRGLSQYISKTKVSHRYKPIETSERREYYPLSNAQKGIYVQHQGESASVAYNITQMISLDCRVDGERLLQAFQKLIGRHESLRTSFEMVDVNQEPVQKIHHEAAFDITYDELTTRDTESTEEKNYKLQNTKYKQITNHKLQITNKKEGSNTGKYPDPKSHEPGVNICIKNFIRPFDLSRAPLLRAGLIRTRQQNYILVMDIHHIIADGFAMEVFRKELISLYESRELPPLRIQYNDYALWQNSKTMKKEIHRQKEFWLKTFKGEIPVLKLPLDFDRPNTRTFEGDHVTVTVGSELTIQLQELGRQRGTTLYMILLAVYFILLSKYAHQYDIVVGSPVSGRTHPDLHQVIGMFVNMLSIRNQPKESKTFKAFLGEVKAAVISALDNQDYHFEELVLDLGRHGDPQRNPLFDAAFSLQTIDIDSPGNTYPTNQTRGKDRENKEGTTWEDDGYHTAKFDLMLGAFQDNHELTMNFEYCTRLFKRAAIQDMANHYKEILYQVKEFPGIKLADIQLSLQLVGMKSIDLREEGDFGF